MAYLIHHLLRQSAARHPERLAIVDRESAITYGELDAQSDRIAAALAAVGVGVGTPVALAFDKSIAAVSALFGILKAGGAYVPIDPFSPPSRAARIIQNCRIAHVVASVERAGKLVIPMLAETDATASVQHLLIPEQPSAELVAGAPGIRIAGWDMNAAAAAQVTAAPLDMDLAYILHTSGSTGMPKGVAITHHNALAFVTMCVDFFAVTGDDRLCSHAPLHFDLSVFDLFVAAAAGARVVLIPPFYAAFPRKMAACIDDCGITIWNSVASALTLMNDRGKLEERQLTSLRAIIFSGEVLPIRVLRALCERMPDAAFYNVYGQTEANSSMYYRVDEVPADDSAKLPIGTTFPNFEVFAIDAEGAVVDRPGREGELYVRASTVAAGYYNDADRTADRFARDPRSPVTGGRVYRTGDLVVLDDNRNYVFVGRSDNLVKSRGYRVELGEIELVLLGCAGVERAAAIAIPDDAIGNRLCAFVSPQPGAALSTEAVLAACRERLPSYMIPEPQDLEIRDSLPHTSTGKVDRNALFSERLART